jgi:DNA-binding transcriptional LysR family regulator
MPMPPQSHACKAYGRRMELRQLSYFRKVAELRSVSKAAAHLHMTQPSLSRQILALERELGHALFDRTPHGVEPTPAGMGLHRHLDSVFAQVERIPEVVRTAGQSLQLVRIGVPQGLPEAWGLALLETVEARLPHVRISLHEATTEDQRQLLQNGLIDIGLIHMDAPELACEFLLRQRMGVAVAPGSRLAGGSAVTFAQLDGLKVMAHAVGEVDVEVSRLRAASTAAQADTEWLFRRFSEHSRLIALAAKVDAVLMTRASASRHLPAWPWIPVMDRDADGEDLDIRTWAAHREPAPTHLRALVEVMKSVSAPDEVR